MLGVELIQADVQGYGNGLLALLGIPSVECGQSFVRELVPSISHGVVKSLTTAHAVAQLTIDEAKQEGPPAESTHEQHEEFPICVRLDLHLGGEYLHRLTIVHFRDIDLD